MSACARRRTSGRKRLVDTCKKVAGETGARLTLTEDIDEGVKGVDYLTPMCGFPMGEAKGSLGRAHQTAQALPDQYGRGQPHRQLNVKFMHRLPAFHNRETKVGEDIYEKTGLDALEVTEEVFESRALDRLRPCRESHAHHQGHHGGHAG